MKSLILIMAMLSLLPSCGKKEKSKPSEFVVREEYSLRPTMYARDAREVTAILRDAVQRGFLYDFDNTRWFNHQGQYLVTSKVIDEQTFKFVVIQ